MCFHHVRDCVCIVFLEAAVLATLRFSLNEHVQLTSTVSYFILVYELFYLHLCNKT